MPRPCRLSSRILVQLAGSISSIDRLPQRWLAALTRVIPDLTRSWIIDRSNSANNEEVNLFRVDLGEEIDEV